MIKYWFVLLTLLYSINSDANDTVKPTLDELLQQIKNSRINGALHKLENGIHWIAGYYVSGVFFRCSETHSLHLESVKHKNTLNSFNFPLLHVEMTVNIDNGSVRIIDIHNIIKGQKTSCSYLGKTE